jgi:hypothetical protein
MTAGPLVLGDVASSRGRNPSELKVWIALFSIVTATAMCFTAAAILLGLTRQNRSARGRHAIIEFLRECKGLSQVTCAEVEQMALDNLDRTPFASGCNIFRVGVLLPGQATSSWQHRFTPDGGIKRGVNITPLLRRMTLLNIEPNALDRVDPLLFRELQGVCMLCQRKDACACDIGSDTADAGVHDWREYCPNAATLSSLSWTPSLACRGTRTVAIGQLI